MYVDHLTGIKGSLGKVSVSLHYELTLETVSLLPQITVGTARTIRCFGHSTFIKLTQHLNDLDSLRKCED